MAERTVRVRLEAVVAGFNAAMDSARARTQGLSDEVVKRGRLQSDALDGVGRTAGIAGLAIAAGLGLAVNASMGFERELSQLRAATGANAATMEQLRVAAIKTGADTQFSALQAAQAETALAKAGVSAADILGGALTGAVSLAAAGQMDLGQAAEVASAAMAQFGLSGKDVGHVADLLAAGAGKAQGTVTDMSWALKQSGLVASQTGLTIEETTGALAAFAQNGLLGSDAGTSFKTMLQRLTPQSKEAAALMQRLGLSAYDGAGNFIGLAKYAGELQRALSGMSAEQRNAAMSTLFGSDSVRAAAVLYKLGAQGVQSWIDQVNDAGYAAKFAATANDNLAGDLEQLRGSIETALINGGTAATGVLRGMTQAVTSAINAYSGLPGPLQAVVTGATAATGGILLLTSATAFGVGQVAAFRASLLALNVQATTVDRTMKALSLTMKLGLGAAAVGGVLVGLDMLYGRLAETSPGVQSLTGSLIRLAREGRATGEVARIMGDDLSRFGERLRAASDSKWFSFSRSGPEIETARRQITALDQALAGLVQGGNAEVAERAFRQLQSAAAVSGISVDELKKQLPGYSDAIEGAANATTLGAGATGTAARSQNMLQKATEAATKALEDEGNRIKALNDPIFAMSQAVQKHADARQAATEAVRNFGAASQQARDAEWALFEASVGVETAAYGLAAGMKSGAVSMDQAKQQLGLWVEQGLVTEDQAGRIEGAIQRVIGEAERLTRTPATLAVSAPDAPAVTEQVRILAGDVRMLDQQQAAPLIVANTTPAVNAVSGLDQFLNSLNGKTVTTYAVTKIIVDGAGKLSPAVLNRADGGTVDFYASGGIRENRVAQIAPAGAWRVWAEPETGGEAYIPFAQSKRGRSVAVWAEAGRRLGVMSDQQQNSSSTTVDRSVNIGSVTLSGQDADVAGLRRELAWMAR